MLAILTVLRNEASRWLPSVLDAWAGFADTIIALDDGSTDATPDILKACPKVDYYRRNSSPMWGAEAGVRKELWTLGVYSGADWLLVLDADMVPASSPSLLFSQHSCDAVAFTLYDLWSLKPPAYRHDGQWAAHTVYRTWAVRNPGPSFEDEWPERGIHTGHFPSNLQPSQLLYAPPEYSLLHLAYSDPTERQRKHAQYLQQADQLHPVELQHAESIIDSQPSVSPLPVPVQWPLRKFS